MSTGLRVNEPARDIFSIRVECVLNYSFGRYGVVSRFSSQTANNYSHCFTFYNGREVKKVDTGQFSDENFYITIVEAVNGSFAVLNNQKRPLTTLHLSGNVPKNLTEALMKMLPGLTEFIGDDLPNFYTRPGAGVSWDDEYAQDIAVDSGCCANLKDARELTGIAIAKQEAEGFSKFLKSGGASLRRLCLRNCFWVKLIHLDYAVKAMPSIRVLDCRETTLLFWDAIQEAQHGLHTTEENQKYKIKFDKWLPGWIKNKFPELTLFITPEGIKHWMKFTLTPAELKASMKQLLPQANAEMRKTNLKEAKSHR